VAFQGSSRAAPWGFSQPVGRLSRSAPATKPVQQNLLAMLMPKTGLEWKVVAAISLVR